MIQNIQNCSPSLPNIAKNCIAGLLVILTITAIALAIIGLTSHPGGPFNSISQLGTTINGTLLGFSTVFLILEIIWLVRNAKHQESLDMPVGISPDYETNGPAYYKDLLSLSVSPNERTLCDRKSGMTCYINAALQVMAHLPFYRKLFDPSHILLQMQDETEGHFQDRKRGKILGNQLIGQILSGSGERATGLG